MKYNEDRNVNYVLCSVQAVARDSSFLFLTNLQPAYPFLYRSKTGLMVICHTIDVVHFDTLYKVL